jgi:hypothetical protein
VPGKQDVLTFAKTISSSDAEMYFDLNDSWSFDLSIVGDRLAKDGTAGEYLLVPSDSKR